MIAGGQMEMQEEIQKLYYEGNKAISEILKTRNPPTLSRGYHKEAVNWGDISVARVEKIIQFDGEDITLHDRIVVHEASPESYLFQLEIQNILYSKGITAEITAEW